MLVAAALTAGCGGGDSGGGGGGKVDLKEGRKLFTDKCASCHALADAEASGTLGPDLDDLQPDAGTVERQIEVGGGAMPKDLLKGKDKEAVAGYVAKVAGSGE